MVAHEGSRSIMDPLAQPQTPCELTEASKRRGKLHGDIAESKGGDGDRNSEVVERMGMWSAACSDLTQRPFDNAGGAVTDSPVSLTADMDAGALLLDIGSGAHVARGRLRKIDALSAARGGTVSTTRLSSASSSSPRPYQNFNLGVEDAASAARDVDGAAGTATDAGGDGSSSGTGGGSSSLARRRRDPSRLRPGRWKLGHRIGRGSFGQVYQGMNDLNGQLIAVKVTKLPQGADAAHEAAALLYHEIEVMRSLSHPNIVRYLGAERQAGGSRLYILQEWVPGGSLVQLIRRFGPFRPPVVRNYTKQVLLGLAYLHANGIVHRDIKCGNLLVDDHGVVKLADFGASRRIADLAASLPPGDVRTAAVVTGTAPVASTGLSLAGSSADARVTGGGGDGAETLGVVTAAGSDVVSPAAAAAAAARADAYDAWANGMPSPVAVPATAASVTAVEAANDARAMAGTPYFMAPEVLLHRNYSPKADVWAVGGAVLQMATGTAPWATLGLRSPVALAEHVAASAGPPPLPADLSAGLEKFLLACFERDPTRRPDAAALLTHPLMAESDSDDEEEDSYSEGDGGSSCSDCCSEHGGEVLAGDGGGAGKTAAAAHDKARLLRRRAGRRSRAVDEHRLRVAEFGAEITRTSTFGRPAGTPGAVSGKFGGGGGGGCGGCGSASDSCPNFPVVILNPLAAVAVGTAGTSGGITRPSSAGSDTSVEYGGCSGGYGGYCHGAAGVTGAASTPSRQQLSSLRRCIDGAADDDEEFRRRAHTEPSRSRYGAASAVAGGGAASFEDSAFQDWPEWAMEARRRQFSAAAAGMLVDVAGTDSRMGAIGGAGSPLAGGFTAAAATNASGAGGAVASGGMVGPARNPFGGRVRGGLPPRSPTLSCCGSPAATGHPPFHGGSAGVRCGPQSPAAVTEAVPTAVGGGAAAGWTVRPMAPAAAATAAAARPLARTAIYEPATPHSAVNGGCDIGGSEDWDRPRSRTQSGLVGQARSVPTAGSGSGGVGRGSGSDGRYQPLQAPPPVQASPRCTCACTCGNHGSAGEGQNAAAGGGGDGNGRNSAGPPSPAGSIGSTGSGIVQRFFEPLTRRRGASWLLSRFARKDGSTGSCSGPGSPARNSPSRSNPRGSMRHCSSDGGIAAAAGNAGASGSANATPRWSRLRPTSQSLRASLLRREELSVDDSLDGSGDCHDSYAVKKTASSLGDLAGWAAATAPAPVLTVAHEERPTAAADPAQSSRRPVTSAELVGCCRGGGGGNSFPGAAAAAGIDNGFNDSVKPRHDGSSTGCGAMSGVLFASGGFDSDGNGLVTLRSSERRWRQRTASLSPPTSPMPPALPPPAARPATAATGSGAADASTDAGGSKSVLPCAILRRAFSTEEDDQWVVVRHRQSSGEEARQQRYGSNGSITAPERPV